MRSTSLRVTVWKALPEHLQPYLADNEAFFTETLPGRDAPLASPGGAAALGTVGVDAPLVAGLPPRGKEDQTHAEPKR